MMATLSSFPFRKSNSLEANVCRALEPTENRELNKKCIYRFTQTSFHNNHPIVVHDLFEMLMVPEPIAGIAWVGSGEGIHQITAANEH